MQIEIPAPSGFYSDPFSPLPKSIIRAVGLIRRVLSPATFSSSSIGCT